jgi:hypothetical protein
MTLDDIYMRPLDYIDGTRIRREAPLGEWPAKTECTEAQRAANANRRKLQIGKPKAPNRVTR